MKLFNSAQIKDDLGGISDVTLYRWQKYQSFPTPKKIRGRRYWTYEQRNEDIPRWVDEQSKTEPAL